MYYVYLLTCGNGKTYLGCTNDLKERIRRHKTGLVPATKEIRPVKLINYFVFTDQYKAFDLKNT